MKRLNPLNDYLFGKYLGEEGDEEQLLSFLNAVLKRTRKQVTLVKILENRVITADILGDKTVILDIRAIANDGIRINIEVQVRNAGKMDRRSLFYWSREYAKGIESGKTYDQLPNVITINIVDYEFLPIDDFHASFHLWEDQNKDFMLTDALEIHFIDMVKFRKLKDKNIKGDSLHRWLTFFDKNTPADVLEEVISMEAAILKAHEKMSFLSSDPDTLRLYEMREMGAMDYASGVEHARNEGWHEGRHEGRHEAMNDIAKKLLELNTPITTISFSTGLDEMAINKIMKDLNNA